MPEWSFLGALAGIRVVLTLLHKANTDAISPVDMYIQAQLKQTEENVAVQKPQIGL